MASWVKVRRSFWKTSKEKRDERLHLATAKLNEANPEVMDSIVDVFGAVAQHSRDSHQEPFSASISFGDVPEEIVKEWIAALTDWATRPPEFCQFISAAFCKPSLRAKMIDDRREIYMDDVARFGEVKADWMYRWDTFRSLSPLAMRFVSWSGLIQLVRDWFRGGFG